ncbi:hypothetical protein AAG570_007289 [Ranatra chinensis]|uniref:Uncharacterized protein n=1 Tax=Ranatra chinensis TaxID=642074 RepID=A0ABD0YAM1_9HEMI
MASKRRNMFHKNKKKQERRQQIPLRERKIQMFPEDASSMGNETLQLPFNTTPSTPEDSALLNDSGRSDLERRYQPSGLYDVIPPSDLVDTPVDEFDKYLKYPVVVGSPVVTGSSGSIPDLVAGAQSADQLDTNHNYHLGSSAYFYQQQPPPALLGHQHPHSQLLMQQEAAGAAGVKLPPMGLYQQHHLPQPPPAYQLAPQHEGQQQQTAEEPKPEDFSHILADVRKTCYTTCT